MSEREEGKRESEREGGRDRKYLTSPLNMDAISRFDIQPIWYEVVLY